MIILLWAPVVWMTSIAFRTSVEHTLDAVSLIGIAAIYLTVIGMFVWDRIRRRRAEQAPEDPAGPAAR